jgi:hypothetical protein
VALDPLERIRIIRIKWLEACVSGKPTDTAWTSLSPRLCHLFFIACCRRIWDQYSGYRNEKAAELEEAYADGVVTGTQREQGYTKSPPINSLILACVLKQFGKEHSEWVKQGEVLINIGGPGWVIKNEWITSTAIAIAKNMYSSGDYSAMPILADALEDVGCDVEVMLERMRSPDQSDCWFRGNRVVDDLLRKRSEFNVRWQSFRARR